MGGTGDGAAVPPLPRLVNLGEIRRRAPEEALSPSGQHALFCPGLRASPFLAGTSGVSAGA